MTLQEALNFVMPFGKYKEQTMQQVVEDGDDGDDGLKYIDWLYGLNNLYPDTRQAVSLVWRHYESEIERVINE